MGGQVHTASCPTACGSGPFDDVTIVGRGFSAGDQIAIYRGGSVEYFVVFGTEAGWLVVGRAPVRRRGVVSRANAWPAVATPPGSSLPGLLEDRATTRPRSARRAERSPAATAVPWTAALRAFAAGREVRRRARRRVVKSGPDPLGR
jgi:hypothetical protein